MATQAVAPKVIRPASVVSGRATTKLRDPQGGLKLDEIREPVFDTVDILSTDVLNGNRQYFNLTQGKTLEQTNMQMPGQFSGGNSFRVIGIGYDVQTDIPAVFAAIPLLIENSRIRLTIAEKKYYSANLSFVAGRIEVVDAVDSGVAQTLIDRVYQKAGDSFIAQTTFDSDHARNIPELTFFSVEVLTENVTAVEQALVVIPANFRIRTMVSLKGWRRRPVQ